MQPSVSIIVPCFNEQATIGALLAAILGQTYPVERLEVLIADARSTDGTREEINRFRAQHPTLRLEIVDNEKRTIPSGLNRAIQASSGDVIVRLDAHSIPISQYVELCVRALDSGAGDSVGGLWSIVPGADTSIGRAIAAAAAHPLGAGDAVYRVGGTARAVDTVPFGAYRRGLLARVGDYDEQLLTNEDYELNFRIRHAGGRVWLDPEIRSEYVARATLGALARQYWRYGFWKFRMLVRHPRSIRWRQSVPPLFLLGLSALAAGSVIWGAARTAFLAVLAVYAAALLAAGIEIGVTRRDARLVPASAAALATMHFSWGGGFLASMVQYLTSRNG